MTSIEYKLHESLIGRIHVLGPFILARELFFHSVKAGLIWGGSYLIIIMMIAINRGNPIWIKLFPISIMLIIFWTLIKLIWELVGKTIVINKYQLRIVNYLTDDDFWPLEELKSVQIIRNSRKFLSIIFTRYHCKSKPIHFTVKTYSINLDEFLRFLSDNNINTSYKELS